jgi:hypothetical protein
MRIGDLGRGMKDSKKSADKDRAGRGTMDDVLKRMLSTPPQPKVKPKPAEKTAKKKPAK